MWRRALFVLVASQYFTLILIQAYCEVTLDVIDECYQYIKKGI